MVEPRRLPHGAPVATFVVGGATVRYNREDIYLESRHLHDMTAQAADAMKEVARLQHAVPEQQQTYRVAIVSVVVLISGVFICVNPTIGWPMAALVGVLGGTHVADTVIRRRARPAS